jgi:hypothetical protein
MNEPLRALLISPFFPPRARVGALRAQRFHEWLPAHGVSPAVVCIAQPGEESHDPHVLRLGTPFDRTVRGGSQSDLGARATVQRRRSPLDAVAESIDRMMPVDTWLPLLLLHLKTMARFARRHRIQVIWSTANPWSSHVMGSFLARQLGVPWIADYRDPWTLDPLSQSRRPGLVQVIDSWVERKLLGRASALIFTSWETERRYLNEFPYLVGRTQVLTNSFRPQQVTQAGPVVPSPTLELLFFGRFRDTSPAELWISAVAALRSAAPEKAAILRIRSVGGLSGPDLAKAQEAGVSELFEAIEPVPYESAPARLACASGLILSLGDIRTDVIPAKLWDYLPVGRPIIAPVHNQDVHHVLQRTGTGIALTPDPSVLASWLETVITRHDAGWLLQIPCNPQADAIAEFGADRSAAALAELMRSVVERA